MGPEESMRIQSNLGSDIAMAFDECVENPAEYDYAKASCQRTLRWLERCKAEHDRLNALPDTVNPRQMLFGINQGATYEDLRVWHMQQIAKIDCDGFAIGGLAVGEPTEVMYQIIEAVEAALYRYMNRPRRAVTDRQWAAFAGRSLLRRGKSGGLVRPNALRGFARTPAAGSGQLARPGLLAFLRGVTPEPVLRRYVTDCFGVSMLTPAELAQAERELCTGPHQNCRLHFTRGEPSKTARSGDAAWDAQTFQKQREKNRAYYNDRLVQNRLVISQLTQKLQNTLLLRSDTDQSRSRAGTLRSDIVWRGKALHPGVYPVREPDALRHPRPRHRLLLCQRLHGAARPPGLRPALRRWGL